MHKVFGIKDNVEYTDREGAYLIPVHNNQIGVIQTSKGYFFLGGGAEGNENHSECLKRECLEEAGYEVSIKEKICSAEMFCKHPEIGYFHPIQTYYFGELTKKVLSPIENDHKFLWVDRDKINGQMYVEMQNWALEQYFNYPLNEITKSEWKVIGELTDKNVLGTDGLSHKEPRKTSRAILINEDNKYAVMYASKFNLHSLPGGGIDEGEDEVSALVREIFEETGCTCDVINPLGIVSENRYHADFTSISYYFVVNTKTKQNILHLTDAEMDNGTTLKWCSLEETIHLIKDIQHETNQRKFLQARDLLALDEYRQNL